MKTDKLTNEERRQWVLNDESLYLWWQSERRTDARGKRYVVSLRTFISENRQAIDETIQRRLSPARR